jgi:Amt family ammonium transporter
MHYIPGLELRVTEEAEILGIDDAEMGEFAYDYVGLEQEIGHTLDLGVGASGGGREPEHHHAKSVNTTTTNESGEKPAGSP